MNTQLSIWNEAERAMPNCVARSALFNVDHVRAKRTGDILRDVEIATNKPIKILYSGEQLRQDDADVWLQLVHIAREDLQHPVRTTCTAMLKALGWSDCAGSKKRLVAVIRRLHFTQVMVTFAEGKKVYGGSLILNFMSEQELMTERTWTLQMDMHLAELFLPHGYTRIDWEIRKKLSPIGKWLQTYLMSHENGLDYEVSFSWLKNLCGSKATDKNWRDHVIAVMPDLVEHGVIKSWTVEPNGKIWPKRH